MTRLLKESSLAAKKSHGSRSGTPFDSPLDLPARTAWTRLAAWTILLASTILFCWPLLTNPKLPDGSDVTYHAQRSHGFYEALGEGVLYPRWLADANRGFGGPDFLVYPPLGYYLVAGTSLVAGDVVEGMRWSLILTVFLSALAFYYSARPLTGEWGAGIGAALYVLVPYRALALYDCFRLSESIALVWFPILFWSVRRLVERRTWGPWFILVGAFAGLLLTHTMSAYLIWFGLGPYALLHARRVGCNWRNLGAVAAGCVVAALCCAAYLVPFLVHGKNVHLDYLDTPHYDWRKNFIYRDEVAYGRKNGLDFKHDIVKPWAVQAATAQIFLALAGGGLLLLRQRKRPRAEQDARAGEARSEGLMHLGLSLAAFVLQTPLSTPLWGTVPYLAAAQFPWRFGSLQMLGCAYLAACLLAPCANAAAGAKDLGHSPKQRRGKRKPAAVAPPAVRQPGSWGAWLGDWLCGNPKKAAIALLVAAAPGFVIAMNAAGSELVSFDGCKLLPSSWQVLFHVPASRPWTFDKETSRKPVNRHRVVYEYLPRGIKFWRHWEMVPQPTPQTLAKLSGPGTAQVLEWGTHQRKLRVETPAPNRLLLRTFVYPGWKASIDGGAAPLSGAPASALVGAALPSGPEEILALDVPAGTHEVHFAFGATSDRRVGGVLSAVGLALLLFLAVVAWRGRKARPAGAAVG